VAPSSMVDEPFVPTLPERPAYAPDAADAALAVRTVMPDPVEGALRVANAQMVAIDRRSGRQVHGLRPDAVAPPVFQVRQAGPGFPWVDVRGHRWSKAEDADGKAIWWHAPECVCWSSNHG
jgi:hypothetical protein